MKDEKFRKALDELAEERELEILRLENPTFDNSIVGLTEDGRLVYSYGKMVKELSKDDKISTTEAMEFIDYNTLRALPYYGDRAPIIIMDTKKEILERYGE